ncbi:hypothetical protein B6U90_01160 [Thermoplasmatales archaeon ex4484_6]|nr:MAG: hypothetical protein B6U90_01160 [Thermoplasmatales archaeon ex4484_6]
MIRPELMEIISPFNFWERELDTGYPIEEYLDRFEDYLKVPSTIVAVTGVRRSGKTYLCRQMIRRLMEKGVNRHSLISLSFPYYHTRQRISNSIRRNCTASIRV